MAFSVTSLTVCTAVSGGPKFHEPAFPPPCKNNFDPRVTYPESGSSTCCHGRVAFGFLTSIGVFETNARTQSGIMRLVDQSPPPITFQALADAAPNDGL